MSLTFLSLCPPYHIRVILFIFLLSVIQYFCHVSIFASFMFHRCSFASLSAPAFFITVPALSVRTLSVAPWLLSSGRGRIFVRWAYKRFL